MARGQPGLGRRGSERGPFAGFPRREGKGVRALESDAFRRDGHDQQETKRYFPAVLVPV
jgi:hypothetical protein